MPDARSTVTIVFAGRTQSLETALKEVRPGAMADSAAPQHWTVDSVAGPPIRCRPP